MVWCVDPVYFGHYNLIKKISQDILKTSTVLKHFSKDRVVMYSNDAEFRCSRNTEGSTDKRLES